MSLGSGYAFAKDFGGFVDYFAKGGGVSSSGNSGGGNLGNSSRKAQLHEIESFLGNNWHQNGSKTKFLNKFKKQLRGDTNADFYIHKDTNEILLKGNRSGVWVNTGNFLE